MSYVSDHERYEDKVLRHVTVEHDMFHSFSFSK